MCRPMAGWLILAVLFCQACDRSSHNPPAALTAEITVKDSGLQVTNTEPSWTESDWPQWRGPTGDGVVRDQQLPTEWDEDTNIAWSVDLPGRGHSSPVICDGRIYLTTAVEELQQQLVLAIDAEEGEIKWQKKLHDRNLTPENGMHDKSTHANSTVACDGELVFAVFLNDRRIHVTALDYDGKIQWETVVGDFDPQFGYAPSPIIYRSVLIVPGDHQSGGFLAAIDRKSGDIVWRVKRPEISSYSSALVANVDGKDQLLICGCRRVSSYDPRTGEENWSCAATTSGTCGTVVADDSHIYASGGFPGHQTACIAGDGSGEIEWSNNVQLYEPSLILSDGLLFGFTDSGIAHCWSASDGTEHWKVRVEGQFSASPIVVNDLIYVPNLDGTTYVVRVSKDRYEEVASNQLGDDTYASIAVSDGALFIRAGHRFNDKRVERLHRIESQ